MQNSDPYLGGRVKIGSETVASEEELQIQENCRETHAI